MNKKIEISASILSCDFSRLGDDIRRVEAAGVDRIHVDVMDGHFVPNITIGQVIVQAVRRVTKLPVEAHLMIENPWDYIDSFADAGADVIQIQAECYGERRSHCRLHNQYPKEVDVIDQVKFRQDLQRIRAKGKQAFAVVNPGTPVCFQDCLKDMDGVLIMSVNPGFSGQKFMPQVLDKSRELRKSFQGDIEIDGGINDQTGPLAKTAGINLLVTASYLFGSSDMRQSIRALK